MRLRFSGGVFIALPGLEVVWLVGFLKVLGSCGFGMFRLGVFRIRWAELGELLTTAGPSEDARTLDHSCPWHTCSESPKSAVMFSSFRCPLLVPLLLRWPCSGQTWRCMPGPWGALWRCCGTRSVPGHFGAHEGCWRTSVMLGDVVGAAKMCHILWC